MTLRRVVVGVDGSRSSFEAVEWSAELARDSDTEIILVHGYSSGEIEGKGGAVLTLAADTLNEYNIAFRTVNESTDHASCWSALPNARMLISL